jgi:hypothetical protein
MKTDNEVSVATDQMLAEGLFVIGGRYYIQTSTYAYRGNMKKVTATHYVLEKAEIVFETGEFDKYLEKGGEKVGSVVTQMPVGELLIERTATVALAPVPA